MLELLTYMLDTLPPHLVDYLQYFFDNLDVVDFALYVVLLCAVMFVAWFVRYAFDCIRGGSV